MKSLTKSGANLADIEISSSDIGSFKKTARKYNIDFSLKKDSAVNPPKWVVFFKAKDSKVLETAFKEFSQATLKRMPKLSFLEKLYKYREKAATIAPPTKIRDKGEIAV